MIRFEGSSANACWVQAISAMQSDASFQDSRDQPTRELVHATFTITDPRQRLVFARPMNPAFAVAEVIWMLAGANDSTSLAFWNPRMRRYADQEGGPLHGAYGYRLGSQPRLGAQMEHKLRVDARVQRLDQIRAAYEALRAVPHSRQVVLQIWDADRDLPNPSPRSRDVPCNLVSHLMVRNGKLEWLQVMRSNDLVWGFPYNAFQFTSLQEIMAGWLGLDVGTYNHVSDSLHVYQRHWGLLEDAPSGAEPPLNRADLRVGSYEEWESLWGRLVYAMDRLTLFANAEDLARVPEQLADLPLAYREWAVLLTAEALRRHGYGPEAVAVIPGAGDFFRISWQRWAETANRGQSMGGELSLRRQGEASTRHW